MPVIVTRVLIPVLVSIIVTGAVALVLVHWPAPPQPTGDNYDYHSLAQGSAFVHQGREHWLALADGYRLFYRYYDAGASTTLIVLHGSGTESRYLSQLAAHLADTGRFNVVTPDLRGHGRSGATGDIDRLGQYDQDLEELIEHFRSRGQRLVVAGHSSGGGLALRYGARADRLQPAAYVFLAPYLGHSAPTTRPNSGEWVTVAVKRWVGLSLLNAVGIHAFNHKPVLFFNRPEPWEGDLQVSSYSYRLAVSFAPNDYRTDIRDLRRPALVLVGEADEAFYPQRYGEVFNSAGSPVSVQQVPEAGHLGAVTSADARERMQRWLQAQKSPTRSGAKDQNID